MKYALVTGGSRGIGRAVSCKLAEMGYFILINYQSNDAEAEKTLQLVQEKGSNGEIMKFDVTDPAAIALALNNWASQQELSAQLLCVVTCALNLSRIALC